MLFKDKAYSYRKGNKASFFLSRRFVFLLLMLSALVLWFISDLWELDINAHIGYLWELLALLLGLIVFAAVSALLIRLYKGYGRATKVHSSVDESSDSKR